MKQLNKRSASCVLLILVLWLTPAVSQRVVVNSIKSETTLDKKATIAQGNIVKQRDLLQVLNESNKELIDSLHLEIQQRDTEAATLRKSYTALKFSFATSQQQLEVYKERARLEGELQEVKYKQLRSKRLGLSAVVGYGFSGDGENAFAGLGLSYTFIRF